MVQPRHLEPTLIESNILESYYNHFNKNSFTLLSKDDRRRICLDLGKGWEWNEIDTIEGGKRLRSWWRFRSARENRLNREKKSITPTRKINSKQVVDSTRILRENYINSSSVQDITGYEEEKGEEGEDNSYFTYDKKKRRKKSKKAKWSKKKIVEEHQVDSSSISASPTSPIKASTSQVLDSTNLLKEKQQNAIYKFAALYEQEHQSNLASEDSNISFDIGGFSTRSQAIDNEEYSNILRRKYSNGELHQLQASGINESSDIIFLQANRLKIGTWTRTLDRYPELMVYYSPFEEGFIFWTAHDNKFFRIILPNFAISSLKIFQSTTTSRLVLLFTRNRPIESSTTPYFETSAPGSSRWVQSVDGDFTQDIQASTNEIYLVEVDGVDSVNEALQEILLSLIKSPYGGELMRNFLEKVWWGDWKEDELSPEGLVESMGLLLNGDERNATTLEYKNSKRSGYSTVVLGSVYHHLKNGGLEGRIGEEMDQVRENLVNYREGAIEPHSGLYEDVLLPSSSPAPSLYYSSTSDNSDREVDSPPFANHSDYTLLYNLDTYSDSFEPQIQYSEFNNRNESNLECINQTQISTSSNAYGFFGREYYPQENSVSSSTDDETDECNNTTSIQDSYHEFPFKS